MRDPDEFSIATALLIVGIWLMVARSACNAVGLL
jgi:hypothetical protein